MTNSDINQALRATHVKLISDNLLAVIGIGSIVSPQKNTPKNDIDYVIVVNSINPKTITDMANIRSQLQKKIGINMSNTLIDKLAVNRFLTNPRLLDDKASQALLEANYYLDHWIYRRPGFTYDVPSVETIKEFSKDNFFELYSLFTKTVIRPNADNKKMAKIVRIMLKMLAQYNHPEYLNTNQDWTLFIPDQARRLLGSQFKNKDHAIAEVYKVFGSEGDILS